MNTFLLCFKCENICEQTSNGLFDFSYSVVLWSQIKGWVWKHYIIIDDFEWKVEIANEKAVLKPKLNYTGNKRSFIEGKYDFGFRVFGENGEQSLCFYSVRIYKNQNF